MKKLLVIAIGFVIAGLTTQPALALSVPSVVDSVEYTYNVQCSFSHFSKNEFCFNYICKYKKYYVCEGDQGVLDLILNIKTVRYPNETAKEDVTNYSVQPR